MKTRQQMLLVNRFRKIANDSVLQGAGPGLIIGMGRHEDRRNRIPGSDQMSVKLGSGHYRHLNVCDQAIGFAEMRRREEIDCRRERLDVVAPRPHESCHGVAKEPVILDDRHQSRFRHTVSNTSIEPAILATLLAVVPAGEFDNRKLRPRVPWGNATAP